MVPSTLNWPIEAPVQILYGTLYWLSPNVRVDTVFTEIYPSLALDNHHRISSYL